jgi:hypothetical protein
MSDIDVARMSSPLRAHWAVLSKHCHSLVMMRKRTNVFSAELPKFHHDPTRLQLGNLDWLLRQRLALRKRPSRRMSEINLVMTWHDVVKTWHFWGVFSFVRVATCYKNITPSSCYVYYCGSKSILSLKIGSRTSKEILKHAMLVHPLTYVNS